MPDTLRPLDTETLIAERYGTEATALPGPASALLDVLLAHRSVRGFLPDTLPEGTLERLVAAAQSASTSSNLQTWSVIAVEDPARKARLSVLSADQGFIREAPLLLVWLADLSRIDRLASRMAREFEAIDHLELFMVALVDAAIAAQNAAAAAESLGLGICWIGAMRNHPEAVAAELALPPRCFAPFGLAVGLPDPARLGAIKPRLPQPLVLHRETYRADGATEAEAVAAYDDALGAFSSRNGMGPLDWSRRVASRLTIRALGGRENMRETLLALGFPLR